MLNDLKALSLNLEMMEEHNVLNQTTHPQNLLTLFWNFGATYPAQMLSIVENFDSFLKNEQLEDWQIYALSSGFLSAIAKKYDFPWNYEFTATKQIYDYKNALTDIFPDERTKKLIYNKSYQDTYINVYQELYDYAEQMFLDITNEFLTCGEIQFKLGKNVIQGKEIFEQFLNPQSEYLKEFKSKYETIIHMPNLDSIDIFNTTLKKFISKLSHKHKM